jgi:hypothetical protein
MRLLCFQVSCCLEADMIGRIKSEMISRRSVLLIALDFAAATTELTSSGAESQIAAMERRVERRPTGRQQHLQARRTNRQERRTKQHSAPRRPKVALALQGGGSHGAYTWGVVDRLLDDAAIDIIGVRGTSAGAINGAVLVNGLMRGQQTEPGDCVTQLSHVVI